MVDQETYLELCQAFLSPAVLSIVNKYYNSYDALMNAAQNKFEDSIDFVFPENVLAELYAFSDYLKDFQQEEDNVEEWDSDEETMDESTPEIFMSEEEYRAHLEEERLKWKEIRRQQIERWNRENEERKQKRKELINSVKKEIKAILKKSDSPLAFEDIVSQLNSLHPSACPKNSIIMACLQDTKLFVRIGKKNIFTLKSRGPKEVFRGSLYEAVRKVLHSKSKPFLMDELIDAVLELRPDSNQKSARAIITSMLKAHRIFLFNDQYIGLDTIRYHKSFKQTQYEARQTFEDKLQGVREFVSVNHRLPFTNGPQAESSLAVWFNRIFQNTNLTTEQMMALYNFKQEVDATDIPQNAEQFAFRQNCSEYKSMVMRTGALVTYSQNDHLAKWFNKYCSEYSKLQDVRKLYFDELVNFLSAFGYELNLR